MDMTDRFFSIKYAGKGSVFSGLNIWKDKKYRDLQGTYPVISLSFAAVKGSTYESTRTQIYQIISNLYEKSEFIKNGGIFPA